MQNILEDKKFQKKLAEIAAETNESILSVKAKAEEYIKELYTVHHPIAKVLGVETVQYILSRGYKKTIDVDPDEMRKLAKVVRSHPVAFVMTHKTYIDMFVLGIVLVRHGLPLPHIFAGLNMAFPGLAQLGRHNGVIFIRRSFKDNLVYKASLRHFIASLIKQKGDFMWAIEGTRSRTGKLVWPKMGILKYIKEAEKESRQKVKYVPVSIVYDLIPDVKEMTQEGRGKMKTKESLSWFMKYVQKMGDKFGRISIRFGDPVEMTDKNAAITIYNSQDSKTKEGGISHFALEVAHSINKITPVTTASLICITLLSKFSLTKRAIESDISALMRLIENQTPDALVDRGLAIGESVQSALNLFLRAGILQQKGDSLNAKYIINPDNYLQATYYANMSVHHLYQRAFIELALLKVKDLEPKKRILAFWKEVMKLRDLFKFEFFYSRKAQFTEEVEANLNFLSPKWQQILTSPDTDIPALLKKHHLFVAPAVLHSYTDAYRVVAQTLLTQDTSDYFIEKKFLERCLFTGEEMHWQGRIQRLESVSSSFLQNGLRLAKHRNLIPHKEDNKRAKIAELLETLNEIGGNITYLQGITLTKPALLAPVVPVERDIVPGSKTESITEDVMKGEAGPHIGAFFDLDRTLIKGFSAKEFFQSRVLSGKMSRQEIVSQFAGVIVYARGKGNFAGLAAVSAKGVRGVDEKVFIEVGEEVYHKHLAETIFPESRALVAAHMAKGHTVAIVSAATPYQVNPIARDLGIAHVMCTRMEVEDGKFTGNVIEPACWGDGKAHAARELTKEFNLDLTKSYFYTDSAEDLPLLEIVGNPRPMNPDTKLAALAFENGWPVYRLNDQTRISTTDMLRTGLAAGSLLPATLRGIMNGLMSMSWAEGINSLMSSVGDLVIQMAGIQLVVKGEENLWAQRPAVFLFNHQSSVDIFIAAKLIRKNATGIAKKELRMMPVIGQLMQAAGVIFIDRKNRESAIAAMKPAVEALKNGTSIIIFPEGTRSKGYRMGAFKKGAFHMAMQAGVPVIPVVIRNAHDAMPNGTTVLKSTAIEVVVHPAIPTKNWKKENLDKKIGEVRQLFLDELGQVEV